MISYIAFLRDNARWLGAGFALSLLSTFGQTSFISVFAGAIMERTGLSDGGWGAVYMLGTTLSAAVMVWAGALADRIPVRRLAGWVLTALAVACAAMATVSSLWLLPLLVLGLRLFGQGMLSLLSNVATARWFAASRGRALAVAAMGFAAGQAVIPLAAVAALPALGATALWLVCGAVCLLAIWPMRALLARDREPEGTAGRPTETAGIGGRHCTRNEVIRTGLFWGLMPLLLGPPTFGTALFFQQVHIAEVKGWSHLAFVALFPVLMGTSIISTFLSGDLIDRIGATRLLSVSVLPMAAGFLLFAPAPTPLMTLPALVLIAVTQGTMGTLPTAFWSELYGTRHIGAIKAAAGAIAVFGTALGPGLTGLLIDRGITFPQQMPWIALYLAASSALAWLVLRRTIRSLAPVPA